MKCMYCGKEIPDGALFCSHCGQKQGTQNGQGAPAPQQTVPQQAAPQQTVPFSAPQTGAQQAYTPPAAPYANPVMPQAVVMQKKNKQMKVVIGILLGILFIILAAVGALLVIRSIKNKPSAPAASSATVAVSSLPSAGQSVPTVISGPASAASSSVAQEMPEEEPLYTSPLPVEDLNLIGINAYDFADAGTEKSVWEQLETTWEYVGDSSTTLTIYEDVYAFYFSADGYRETFIVDTVEYLSGDPVQCTFYGTWVLADGAYRGAISYDAGAPKDGKISLCVDGVGWDEYKVK